MAILFESRYSWSQEVDLMNSLYGFKVLGVCAAGNFRPNIQGFALFMTAIYSGRSSPKSFHGADS